VTALDRPPSDAEPATDPGIGEPVPATTATAEPAGKRVRAARRAFRSTRSVPAVIVAALLAAVALLAAAEVIARLVDRSLGLPLVDRLTRFGRDTAWDDARVLMLAGIAGVLGLLLLALALWPGRSRVLPVDLGLPGVVAGISRGGLRRLAAQAAATVDCVGRVRVKAGRRRVVVRAASPLHDPSVLAGPVDEAVTTRLAQLTMRAPPAVKVVLHGRRERRS
jgi:hypothetical protein